MSLEISETGNFSGAKQVAWPMWDRQSCRLALSVGSGPRIVCSHHAVKHGAGQSRSGAVSTLSLIQVTTRYGPTWLASRMPPGRAALPKDHAPAESGLYLAESSRITSDRPAS